VSAAPGRHLSVADHPAPDLRPATPDNLPILEERDGALVVSGHGRNGVLLAPLAAELAVAELEGVRAA